MGVKRKVSAREILEDLEQGRNNSELMERYGLSAKGLTSIFRKLINAGAVTESQMQDRMPSVDDTVDLENLRREPRCYPVISLPVSDFEELDKEYAVMDLTEKGLQIIDMEATVGEIRNFLINPVGFSDIEGIKFKAECKWVKLATDDHPKSAGFEIIEIDDPECKKLEKVISSATFCD